MADSYWAYNGHLVTTAAPTKVPTGTSVKTLLQIASSTSRPLTVFKWGISFDGASAGTPVICELIETGNIAATVTAFNSTDIFPYGDPNSVASTVLVGTTAQSGFTASAEGSITTSRYADLQQVQPTNQYEWEWSLGREFKVKAGNIIRVRVTAASSVNALCFIAWEE